MLRQRAVGDGAGRPQRFVVVAERATISDLRNADREIHAANAGAADGGDAHAFRAVLDRAGIETGDFGVVPPGFAFPHVEVVAAAGERDQRGNNDGAEKGPLNRTRHARTMEVFPLRTAQ